MSIDIRQMVVFRLGEVLFGLNIEEVREIIKSLKTTRIPETEQWMEGVVELRQKVIPIIDLRKLFGFSNGKTEEKRTVVVEVNDTLVGLNVDSVEGISQLSPDSISRPPEMISKEYIKGITRIDEQLIILLDIANLLSAEQIEDIKTVVEEIQEKT